MGEPWIDPESWSLSSIGFPRTAIVLAVCGLVIVLAAVASTGQGSPDSEWSASDLGTTASLLDVAQPDGSHVYAVGEAGTVFGSSDGGESWHQLDPGTGEDLYAVSFTDAETGWVAGEAGTVSYTDDGGETWTARDTGLEDSRIRGLSFVDAEHGWAVGYDGVLDLILHTEDGGQSWTQQQASQESLGLLDVSFADREHGIAVSTWGGNYWTQDGGQTWINALYPSIDASSVDHASPQEAFVTGDVGLYRTNDGGITWSHLTDFDRSINDVAATQNTILVVGDDGLIARSDDFGASFATHAAGTSHPLNAVDAPTLHHATAVADRGVATSLSDHEPVRDPLKIAPFPERYNELTLAWDHEASGTPNRPLSLDVDRDGTQEIVFAAQEGLRAVSPREATEEATLWHVDFQASLSHLASGTIGPDDRPFLVAGTDGPGEARTGILLVDGATGDVRWSLQLDGGGVAAVATTDLTGDGTDEVILATDDDALRTFDARTGEVKMGPIPMDGAIVDLAVGDLAGDGSQQAIVGLRSGEVVVLDPLSGDQRWSHGDGVELTEAVAAGDLDDDGIDEVVLTGRGEPESTTTTSPDGSTSVGSSSGPLVRALDEDGAVLWDYGFARSGSASFGHVDVADVTGDGGEDVVAQHARTTSGQVIGFDGEGEGGLGGLTGEPLFLWQADTSSPGNSQRPYTVEGLLAEDATGDGHADAFLGMRHGALLALDGAVDEAPTTAPNRIPQAEALWTVEREQNPMLQPAIHDDGTRTRIVQASNDNLLTLRNASTGELTWAFDGGGHPEIASGDLTGDGREDLAVGTSAGRAYGLSADGDPLADGDAPFLEEHARAITTADVAGDDRDEIVALASTGQVSAIDPRTADTVWARELGAAGHDALSTGKHVAVATAEDLEALVPETGQTAWTSAASESWRALAFSASGERLAAGDASGTVHLFDSEGEEKATVDVSDDAVTQLEAALLDDGPGFVAIAGPDVEAFTAQGASAWTATVGQAALRLAVGDLTGDGVDDALVNDFNGFTRALDGEQGATLWTRATGWANGDLAIADLLGEGRGLALVSTPAGTSGRMLEALDAQGTPVVSVEPNKEPHRIEIADTAGDGTATVVLTTRQGDVYALEPTLPVNKPPRLEADAEDHAVIAGQATSFSLEASDPEGAPVAFEALGAPEDATFVDQGDGSATFAWTPTREDEGSWTITFRASDGTISTDEQVSIRVLVGTVLDAPAEASGVADTSLRLTVTAVDDSGSQPSLRATSLPDDATFTSSADGASAEGVFAWTPGPDDVGEHEAVFEASAEDRSTTATTTITVEGNQPPQLLPDIPELVTARENVLFSAAQTYDPDGSNGNLQYDWVVETARGEPIERSGDSIHHAFERMGQYDVSLTVEDETGRTSHTTRTVTVDDALIADASISGVDQDAVGLRERPAVVVSAVDDRSQPVDAQVSLEVSHEDLGTVHTANFTLGSHGIEMVRLPTTLDVVNVPGEHRVDLTITADPRAKAPVQEPHEIGRQLVYHVAVP